jgi:hypothetical protein
MKSLISTVVGVAIVAAGLLAVPGSTRAQTAGDGQAATPTPTTPPAADPAAPTPAGLPVPSASIPAADDDPAPEDPAADVLIVREERIEVGEPGFGPNAGRNVAHVRNRSDGSRRFRARIRLVRAPGDRVEPVNAAIAHASCTDCETFAVALEIALISPSASVIVPRNIAQPINYRCTRCVTVARAMQYVYGVEDPDQVPDNVRRLLQAMETELRAIGQDPSVTATQANARIDAVFGQFTELNSALQDHLAEAHEETSPGAGPDAVPAAPVAPVPMPSPAITASSMPVMASTLAGGPTHRDARLR